MAEDLPNLDNGSFTLGSTHTYYGWCKAENSSKPWEWSSFPWELSLSRELDTMDFSSESLCLLER